VPDLPSKKVLIIKIYLGDDVEPIWLGAFDIIIATTANIVPDLILEPTVTPAPRPTATSTNVPTITPTPPLAIRIFDQYMANFPMTVFNCFTIIIALGTFYFTFIEPRLRKNKGKKARSKN
jgi:hypothetical protein